MFEVSLSFNEKVSYKFRSQYSKLLQDDRNVHFFFGFVYFQRIQKFVCYAFIEYVILFSYTYLPTPPLGQDMTQGQLLSGV